MPILSRVKALRTVWLISKNRLAVMRYLHRLNRKIRGKPLLIHYYHRVDDPSSYLMVQALLDLYPILARFKVTIVPHVVERLPASMYPDPARYEAHSILDSQRLASVFGYDMPIKALVPDRLGVQMVSRHLSSLLDPHLFLQAACSLGSAVWSQDQEAIRNQCSVAKMDDAPLRQAENDLIKRGGFASATLFLEGEIYSGIERLYLFLNQIQQQLPKADNALWADLLPSNKIDPKAKSRLSFLPGPELERWREYAETNKIAIAGKIIDFYVDFENPYSHLAMIQMEEFEKISGAIVRLRLVRGPFAVPHKTGNKYKKHTYLMNQKKRNDLLDCAREARAKEISFIRFDFHPPTRSDLDRSLSLGLSIRDRADQFRYFYSLSGLIWQGIKSDGDQDLAHKALVKSGLSIEIINNALTKTNLRSQLENNRQKMLRAGLWQAPGFVAEGQSVWGQDRILLVAKALAGKS